MIATGRRLRGGDTDSIRGSAARSSKPSPRAVVVPGSTTGDSLGKMRVKFPSEASIVLVGKRGARNCRFASRLGRAARPESAGPARDVADETKPISPAEMTRPRAVDRAASQCRDSTRFRGIERKRTQRPAPARRRGPEGPRTDRSQPGHRAGRACLVGERNWSARTNPTAHLPDRLAQTHAPRKSIIVSRAGGIIGFFVGNRLRGFVLSLRQAACPRGMSGL